MILRVNLVVAVAKDVVRRLLCVDPVERITLSELLRHPWFSVSVESFFICDSYLARSPLSVSYCCGALSIVIQY